MPTKIGQFEILSELAKSPTGAVYKANDPESGQTIALKTIQLSAFGDSSQTLEHALLAEAESTKVLNTPNITQVYGAGEIEGQFCAAMDYVQGNSIATMLARKEGFSIWDLLDIGRQLCSGLDHAASHRLVHYSLEPAKIMCGWDGTVKILSFGVSSVGNFACKAPGLPSILHYMSPEQVRGEATDARSNLYSLGAMFYEMATERKAFDREDVENLCQSILGSTPVAPIHVNPKIHPLLSELIMKALSKDPAQRYQNGRELLDDLEKCKESKPAAAAARKTEAPKGLSITDTAKRAAQSKFVNTGAAKSAAVATPKPVAPRSPAPAPAQPKPPAAAPAVVSQRAPSTLAKPSKLAVPKASAAAAGFGGMEATVPAREMQELDLSDHFVGAIAPPVNGVAEQPSGCMSSAVADEPMVETFEPQTNGNSPKIAVDPMMAEGGSSGGSGTSFSDIAELPPLKESYVEPTPPPTPEAAPVQSPPSAATVFRGERKEEKPRVQPREVAQKAIKEIKGVPPKLMLYSLAGAGILILVIAVGMTIYIHSQNSDEDSGSTRTALVSDSAAQLPSNPAPKKDPAPAPVAAEPVEVQQPDDEPAQPAVSSKTRGAKKKASAPAPVVIPGQLTIDSTPQGAQVQLDGATDPSWVTPLALTNLQPGEHSITVSKPGYSSDSRSVNVTSGIRSTATVHLAQLMATVIVKSDPPGAGIYVDGRDMATKTPAQVSVGSGPHLVLVRLPGYLDETMNGQFVLGQTFSFSPTLRQLGNVDSIKTVGKMSKLFGGKGAQAGQATVSIRTQPKGAQVSVNQHMLDKTSPVDVVVDPGSYLIDITLTGYGSIHKVVTADKGSKVAVDEVLQRQ